MLWGQSPKPTVDDALQGSAFSSPSPNCLSRGTKPLPPWHLAFLSHRSFSLPPAQASNIAFLLLGLPESGRGPMRGWFSTCTALQGTYHHCNKLMVTVSLFSISDSSPLPKTVSATRTRTLLVFHSWPPASGSADDHKYLFLNNSVIVSFPSLVFVLDYHSFVIRFLPYRWLPSIFLISNLCRMFQTATSKLTQASICCLLKDTHFWCQGKIFEAWVCVSL